ncbi:hypothetical protein [Saccharothrix variisporea]|uniref:Uncharacterized protein n=1 Tax=Saccharothrix variisporea TaxID=543527 RepID=A0A495X4T0_9PSEU|nr:hypothetical protein [Saccharothrix variisporea]RKT67633.1 hypothetical protein DFJ66_0809 [Saccharothrix variisporea]
MRTLRTTLAAVGTAVLLVTAASHATATPLPPVGQEFEVPLRVVGLAVVQDGVQRTYDATGTWKVKVEANPEAPLTSVLLDTNGFTLSGRSTGGPDVRTITIRQSAADPRSVLRLVQAFPPKYEQVVVQSFATAFDQAASPMNLVTKEPARLMATLTRFPPTGEVFKLQNAVALVDPANPAATLATIPALPLAIGVPVS